MTETSMMSMHSVMSARIRCSPLVLSLFLLLYFFLPSFILSCFLLMRIGGPAEAYWSSLLLLGALAFCFREKISCTDAMIWLLLILFCHVFSWYFFDFSHDGLAYHQPAIRRIVEGFNPVSDGYMDFGRPPDGWSDQGTWFPKATWYFAASVTAVFGDIQLGKAYQLLILFTAVFFVQDTACREHPLKRLLWLVACLNPVTLRQAPTFMVDGVLGSLCLIALAYVHRICSGKAISRTVHVIGIVSLATLCCVKTSGFAYACIVIFWICLHHLVVFFATGEGTRTERILKGFIASFGAGMRLSGAVLLLAAVIGFSPYVTNLLQHRHIFFPLIQGEKVESAVGSVLEEKAQTLYPGLENRLTRLLFSIAAYPTFDDRFPAETKKPLEAPWLEWQLYKKMGPAHAGGLGPLFYLLCLLSVGYALLLRIRGRFFWTVLTLLTMVAIQPHSWQVRYVPFMWLLPIFLLLDIPLKKEYLLLIPLFLFFVDISGITYVYMSNYRKIVQNINEALSPYRGQIVLLDKSIFQCDGFFDRFNIKQKFSNPEQAGFVNTGPWREYRPQRHTGRPVFGSNIAFAEDIPLFPKAPVIFTEKGGQPWVRMSEAVNLYDPDEGPTALTPFSFPVPRGLWNYAAKVKFFTQITSPPEGDKIFALTATPRIDENGEVIKQTVRVFSNNQYLGEWLFDRPESTEKTVILPRAILEESYSDEMHLLTLMFYLSNPDAPGTGQMFTLMFEKMEFRTERQEAKRRSNPKAVPAFCLFSFAPGPYSLKTAPSAPLVTKAR